jgi:hypothetical protein
LILGPKVPVEVYWDIVREEWNVDPADTPTSIYWHPKSNNDVVVLKAIMRD